MGPPQNMPPGSPYQGAHTGAPYRIMPIRADSPISGWCPFLPAMTEETRWTFGFAFRHTILPVGADPCVGPKPRHQGRPIGAHTPVRPSRLVPSIETISALRPTTECETSYLCEHRIRT